MGRIRYGFDIVRGDPHLPDTPENPIDRIAYVTSLSRERAREWAVNLARSSIDDYGGGPLFIREKDAANAWVVRTVILRHTHEAA